MSTKYQPLADHLVNLSVDEVPLSFEEIEQILGTKLPDVAYSSPAFWANSKTNDSHTWAHLWQAAGWEATNVDVGGQKLVFRRIAQGVDALTLSPKQVRILQYLASAPDWSTRKEMEDATGPKGFSLALGAPTAGPVQPGTLEGMELVERAEGPAPFKYRITAPGREALKQLAPPGQTGPVHTAIVLTENEVYAGEDFGWADKTGEQYEFPNRYRAMIVPGTPFIYYKGRRRADGSSATPEYYGHGVVGEVNPTEGSEGSPAAKRRWTAAIDHWTPFEQPVGFQAEDGQYLETGSPQVAANYWRDGVRRINRANYVEILLRGGASPPAGEPVGLLIEDSGQLLEASGSLIKVVSSNGSSNGSMARHAAPRRSKHAKAIGTAAEKLFFELLRSQMPADDQTRIRWVAQEGLTPGYDIEDGRASAEITAYEVKGTTGSEFRAVDITVNEMKCALKLRSKYALVLVSGVGSSTPRYQIIADVAKRLDAGEARATPTVFSLEFSAPVPVLGV